MGLANADYGVTIPPNMALFYILGAVIVTFVFLGLLFLVARSNARNKNSCCIEGHC
ncbi:hypothetical protein [Methanosarcina sp.]|uniref:hypothetical protein n=1 Tax=Methanosarcina sp. TaxID=2213 RepID=UPI00298853EA|nr:hypothetical protein [Methanosarcina sp.]MDW5549462.1 hypothetical protein [Methanosarcina sp.]MDW5553347.1 hypothetical protein [Methanosarcina sp.]MDW5559671.1 hypothetical protein [Methanosarcina sp.]